MGLESNDERALRDMLSRTLAFAVASLLAGSPVLIKEAESLGAAVKSAHGEAALQEIATRLKELCYRIELKTGDDAEQQELLLRLFKLLLENVGELLEDGSWMRGQVAIVQELIAGPIDQRTLEDATRSLKDVIYKQGQLKHGLSDVKLTVKNMMMTFIERLGLVAQSTGEFHTKIGGFSTRIRGAEDIETARCRAQGSATGNQQGAGAGPPFARPHAGGAPGGPGSGKPYPGTGRKLRTLSDLVVEDQLTGSLNRRGLDELYERESARADRRNTPLCVALLDLDDFKKLNDTYGHIAGDSALKHLVKIVKDTLRSMDVIARFGGEEFLIVLPETTIEAAAATMTRLQRELTRQYFLHENEKLLITFSAGVALRLPNEDQTSLVRRADRAMYQAKQAGKNRVGRRRISSLQTCAMPVTLRVAGHGATSLR